jgi:hypothetical protein
MTDYWARSGVIYRDENDLTIGVKEAFPVLKAKGYGWVGLDPSTGDWQATRTVAAVCGLDVIPWTRVISQTQIDLLRAARSRWNSGGVAPNVEIGNGGTGSTRDQACMASVLRMMQAAGRGLLITDGWADPIGCWTGYRRFTGSVECFPQVNPLFEDVRGCMLHAGAFFHRVIPMLGAYGTGWKGRLPKLSDYDVPTGSPHIVFTGDDVANWADW